MTRLTIGTDRREQLVDITADVARVVADSGSGEGIVHVGASAVVPFSGGRLSLGAWQAIYFCEFDGPRTRSVLVSMVPG